MLRNLFLVLTSFYGAGNVSLIADTFTLTQTITLGSEDLGNRSKFFRVGSQFVVVNAKYEEAATSINVYAADGTRLHGQTYTFETANTALGSDQAVYLASRSGEVARYGIVDDVRWVHKLSRPTYSSEIYVGKDVIYASTGKSDLFALSKKDGSELWAKPLPDQVGGVWNLFFADNNMLEIFGTVWSERNQRQVFYRLDAATGDLKLSTYYQYPNAANTIPLKFYKTEKFVMGKVADNRGSERFVKTDFDGNVVSDVGIRAMCPKQNGGFSFEQVAGRMFMSCFNSENNKITTTLFELNTAGEVIKEIGTTPSTLRANYKFGEQIIFSGGLWVEDGGLIKFSFWDGQNLSPQRTVIGNHEQYPAQQYHFDELRTDSELAVMAYDANTGSQFVLVFDAK